MGIRARLLSRLRPAATPDPREEAQDAALAAMRAEVDALKAQVAEAHEHIARLDKRLGMAMGAVQASTAQLQGLRTDLTRDSGASAQALQQATSALATAEAAADGVTAVEQRLDALIEKLGTATPVSGARKPRAKA